MGGNLIAKELSNSHFDKDPFDQDNIDVAQYYGAVLPGYSLGDLVSFGLPVGL